MELLLSGAAAGYSPAEGYARCAELARSHYENFTVGSWLMPRAKRDHIYAVYAFCRSVDDLGDEHHGDKHHGDKHRSDKHRSDKLHGDRLAALDAWEQDLKRCYDGKPSHPYMVALQQTIRAFDIPPEPFLRLVEANRNDQTTTRYPTFDDLDYYCRRSANPVGHLVLYLFGHRDSTRQALSDYTCTALQLANFWQDVARDYSKGRIYIPQEDMERFGYSEDQLSRREVSDGFRRLMEFEVARARELFHLGIPLIDTLEGRLKLDVALYSLGGLRVLDAIEAQRYDVLTSRPKLTKASKFALMLTTSLRLGLNMRLAGEAIAD